MSRTLLKTGCALLLALLPLAAFARLEAPDHIVYGNVSLFGQPAAPGTVIEMRTLDGSQVLARYELGRDLRLGDQYALRVPMDLVDPRTPGRARPGDPVQLFVSSQFAAAISVGQEGTAVRLDLDPQNSGTGPAVTVADAEVFEGSSGTVPMIFAVSLNQVSDSSVELGWQTVDDSATGGESCTSGVDYLSASDTLVIAAGGQGGSITVQVCGDTDEEPDETFELQLSLGANGALSNNPPVAVGTITGDDDVPELRLVDARVLEPQMGSTEMLFLAQLSRSGGFPSSFSWATQAINATPGVDYAQASGDVVMQPGELEAEIRIVVFADGDVEPPESLRLLLSNPVNVAFERNQAEGVIIDPAHDPSLSERPGIEGGDGGVESLLGPTAIAISDDGAHAYVVSEATDSLQHFERNQSTGVLTLVRDYDAADAGFDALDLDGPRDVLLGNDGNQLYVAARTGNTLTVFARDAGSGALSLAQTVTDSVSSDLDGPVALAASPDGGQLYVSAADSDAVLVFARDPGDGTLALVDTENRPADGGDAEALDYPSGLVVSPDGAQLYLASRLGNAVLVFARAGDGQLTWVASHRDNLADITGLSGAYDLVLSADGAQLYVSAEGEQAVTQFDRAGDGSLDQVQVWRKGEAGLAGLGGAQGLALSPDGAELYVTGFGDHSLTVFDRASDGALEPAQTVFDEEGGLSTLGGPTAVAASPDDKDVYVVANVDNAIVVFRRVSAETIFDSGFE